MARIVERDALWEMNVVASVIDGGSVAAAARALRLTPSAVSKQLARVEQRLGVRLIERTTRRLRPTAAGLRYREHAVRLLRNLSDAEDDVRADSRVPRGLVRVTAPTLFGQEVVAPVLARFLLRFPEVEVELILDDAFVDLVKERIDVAVRVASQLPPSGLLARKVGDIEYWLVASPAYLERRAVPARPSDLSVHACLDLAHAPDRGHWRMTEGGRAQVVDVSGPLVSTSLPALHNAALEGLGIAQIPRYLAQRPIDEGRLVRVLPNAVLPGRFAFALHAAGALAPARVRELSRFLLAELPERTSPGARGRARSKRKT
ncbi:Transcriptional regulator, LysR family [Labilithrix luteola]|uniref:Transcriptional regulator, LysR family n=1 Tax=Labilithrix luteola TaxID=1391654 RepID=A0A0K1Q597_9BACT|nr:LysR family transcriptional regulator [Labilithrix luteola]AKV00580.1 Transcriptional regulator, LysR family [Labilithrix luteola]